MKKYFSLYHFIVHIGQNQLLINKLCQKDNTQEKNIEILCNIAMKINIQNNDELNAIYGLLNEKRGYTYEFYVIILIAIYAMSKCQTEKKEIPGEAMLDTF